MVQRILRLLIVMVIALLTASHGLPVKGQQANPSSEDIDQTIEQMSVEEKVGQLFMVELFEPATDLGPDIQELIQDYKVGAVILIARNGNFSNTETELGSTPLQVANLTARLQALAYEGSIDTDGATFYAPLLIAVDHEGDGWPYTRIRQGVADIPSNMAIGATWSEESAAAIGAIVGQELDAMGVNMLLGPVIDVLHQQSSAEGGDQGVRLMSASPFWVGKLGRAYIRGVHEGSNNQVTTVAKHFPGHGRSDRLPDEEVSFLDVSLDELRHSDLIPFFMVTEYSEQDPAGVTDALMSSHIQYELSSGQKSGPVSLVPGAMESVLGMPELDDWRSSGLILADALGAIAVQKYYQFEYGEPSGTFNHRRVAMDAFIAGNDLLMLVDYAALGSARAERYRVMKDTIRYFQDEYNNPTNSAFRERVDAVLRKILRLKLRLYPNLSYAEAQIDLNRVEALVGTDLSEKQVGDVAEAAITLVAGQSDFRPPQKQDNILIVTDSYRPPFGDPPTPPLTTDQIEQTILALYGPSRSGLVDPARITSWSFDEMATLLEASGEGSVVGLHGKCRPPEWVELVDRAPLDNADWIIFAMPDLVRCGQGEKLVTAFLRSNLLRPDHKVVVFALGAPYYLDSTDVNKLTAYYGVYSKVPPFIEVAVRALFGEVDPHRAHPVDIGKSYVLDDQLRPDPAQPWGIRLVTPLEAALVLEGDEKITIEVQTSQLLDRNKNVVPDGTPIIFRLLAGGGTLLRDWKVETEDGVARLEVPLSHAGNLSLQAIPDGFTRGEGKDLSIRVQEPTSTPTSTSLPTNTPTPTPTSTPVPLPTNTPTPAPASTPLPPDKPQVELVTPVNSLWKLLSSPGGADTIVGGIIVTLIAGLLTGSAAVLFRLVTKRRKK